MLEWEKWLARANVPNRCFWTILCSSVHLWQSAMFQMVPFLYFSHFARPPSSETHFSMTKHDPKLVRKSLALDACRAERAIGADTPASLMWSKSLSLDAHRSNCVSDMFKSILVVCSYLLSLDARRSKCAVCLLKCALARRPPIQMRFLCAQRRSRSTP